MGYQNSLAVRVLQMMTVVMILLVVACGPAQQTGAPVTGADVPLEKKLEGSTQVKAAEVAKQRGGKLVMSQSSAFGNPNDPHLPATATGRIYFQPVTNGILKRDLYEKYAIAGDLAKSWELSKDGLTYTFKFNQGVKFQNVPPVNGREFTSDDAKYLLMRITADPSVVLDKWKPRFQRAIDFGKIDTLDTPDKYTLVVKLKEPYSPFLDAVANPGTVVIPKEFVEKFTEKVVLEGAVGTGPFIPVDYKNQQIASYKKNPDYWKKDSAGGQLPYVDELNFLYFADLQTELAALRSGQLDVSRSAADINKGMVTGLQRDVPNVQVFRTPVANITNFRFNTKVKAFQDVRVRRAFHLAIDRYQFSDLITEGLGVVSGPVTSPVFADVTNTTEWLQQQPGYRKDKTKDMADAKQLMKDAGYGDGLTLGALGYISAGVSSADVLALLADQLKPLNITLKSETVDYAGQWLPRATAGEFELAYMSHTVGTDVDSVIAAHLLGGAPRNYGKFSSQKLDDLIKKEQAAITSEERKKWAQEAEQVIFDEAPMLFLYTNVNTMLASPWVRNAASGAIIGSEANLVEQAWLDKH
ncbi:MAG: ABC transporter substrate-binding protein [Dehalococcoidia bacterium]|nr:ABC transporter substrate-binding protein [Dehalococcoidia bacterium]